MVLHDESSWPHGSYTLVLIQPSGLGNSGETLSSSEPMTVIGQTRSCRSLTSRPLSSLQLPRLISPLALRLRCTVVLCFRPRWVSRAVTACQEFESSIDGLRDITFAEPVQLHAGQPRTPTSFYSYAIHQHPILGTFTILFLLSFLGFLKGISLRSQSVLLLIYS